MPAPKGTTLIPILDVAAWQMVPGERAALVGLLSQVRPDLAIEIGTAEGGSLRCISQYSGEVLSFDLVAPAPELRELANVTFHTGDNHELLPKVLTELTDAGRSVDFVLVDGDHTASGVEQDVRDLLASDAIRSTVVVFHDTMNDEVRAGLQRIDYAGEPKVAYCDLDFVSGRLNYGGVFHHQLWGGLGVMVVDAERATVGSASPTSRDAYSVFDLVAPARDALIAFERAGGAATLESVGDAVARDRRAPRPSCWRARHRGHSVAWRRAG